MGPSRQAPRRLPPQQNCTAVPPPFRHPRQPIPNPRLGLDIGRVGALASSFPVAYGISKFASGVLCARASPAALLAGGLAGTAAANAALAAGGGLPWFCALWALNGALQGVGGPACARMLTAWFPARERGT